MSTLRVDETGRKVADIGTPTDTHSSTPRVLLCAAVAVVIVLSALVFVLARRLEWGLGWTYVGIMVLIGVINLACLLRWNPELIERRMWPGEGTKTWDWVWLVLFTPAMIATFVVAVLELRAEVPSVPGVGWLLGLTIFIPGWTLIIWSMVVNPFFEKTVRIQSDHGHRVIDTGPYAYVRHPGYVGFSAWIFSTPLLLGSALAFVPAVLTVFAFVIRTVLEDRMLQTELPGYAAYASRVRFRLIPGVW